MPPKRGREEETKAVGNPICCLCKKECECQYGNNPDPVVTPEGARCCNVCNMAIVLPARLGIKKKSIQVRLIIPGMVNFYDAFGGEEEFDAFMEDEDKRILIEPLRYDFQEAKLAARHSLVPFAGEDIIDDAVEPPAGARVSKKQKHYHVGVESCLTEVVVDSVEIHIGNQNAILEKCRELKKGWTKIPVGGKTPSPTKMTAAEANEIMRLKKEDDKTRNDSLRKKESEKKRIENEMASKKLSKKLRKQKQKDKEDKDKDVGGGGI